MGKCKSALEAYRGCGEGGSGGRDRDNGRKRVM